MNNIRRLHNLARRYHQKCEAHDRRICSGAVIKGRIMPANMEELRLVKYFADFELDWIIIINDDLKVMDIKLAIKDYEKRYL